MSLQQLRVRLKTLFRLSVCFDIEVLPSGAMWPSLVEKQTMFSKGSTKQYGKARARPF